MVQYRRNLQSGGTYFFTATLKDRRSSALTTHVDTLRAAFKYAHESKPFHIDAIVILPEHLHTVWTLPEGDADYPSRWRSIKSRFIRLLDKQGIDLLAMQKASTSYGNPDIGNIRSAMILICSGMWIICITTRSSMGW